MELVLDGAHEDFPLLEVRPLGLVLESGDESEMVCLEEGKRLRIRKQNYNEI